jgi:hypothetical protein
MLLFPSTLPMSTAVKTVDICQSITYNRKKSLVFHLPHNLISNFPLSACKMT